MMIKDLDERGIIRLVLKSDWRYTGWQSNSGETELTAEERLLRAIFGEKPGARDTLRLPMVKQVRL